MLTMNDSKPPKPKLRWYQYRLRSLMVLMVVLCLGFGWLGDRIRRIVAERSAVPQIQAIGGRSIYGVTEGARHNFRTKLEDEMLYTIDEGLRNMLGVDHTFVNSVELDNTGVTDADLAILDGLSYLEYLTLSNTQITDAGLLHLYDFSYLQIVDVTNTQVTDEGVKKLEDVLPNCRVIR